MEVAWLSIMLRFLGVSEFKCDVWHFHVFLLWELVLKGGEELRVDLIGKTLYIVNSCLQVLFFVFGHLLHLPVPCVHSFDCFGSQYQTGCSNFGWSVLQKTSIEHWYFYEVLSEVEDLVVWCSVANFSKSF